MVLYKYLYLLAYFMK